MAGGEDADSCQELVQDSVPGEETGGGSGFGAEALLFFGAIGQVGDVPGRLGWIGGVQDDGVFQVACVLFAGVARPGRSEGAQDVLDDDRAAV